MTNQDLYNDTVRDVINQEGASVNYSENKCAFRGNNGRKCVVGHKIPDKKYFKEMEKFSLYNSSIRNSFEHTYDFNFMRNLQNLHDYSAINADSLFPKIRTDTEFFELWIPAMIRFAKSENLDYSVFKEFLGDELVAPYLKDVLFAN